MKVETLPGFEALDEERWNALLGRAGHPSVFLSWQWQTAWTRAFLGGRPLHLLRVSDDAGTLAGLLPSTTKRRACAASWAAWMSRITST